MKKLKNRMGFTLIELLAVIIILGVLLLIAVPTVSKYIESSRLKTYKNSLLKMVDAVSVEVNAYQGAYNFTTKEYLVVPCNCIEVESGSIERSPFGKYQEDKTFIVVTRDNNSQFQYYVSAMDDKGYGNAFSLADEIEVKPITEDKVGKITNEGMDLGIYADLFVGKKAKYVTCDSFSNIPQEANTLADVILASNPAKDTERIDFSKPSSDTNGKGLYKANDDNGVSYFFRGDVNNNYVQFGGGFTEKIVETVTRYYVYTYLEGYKNIGYERFDTESECNRSDELLDSVDEAYCHYLEDEGKYVVVFVGGISEHYGDTPYVSLEECEASDEYKEPIYDDIDEPYYEKWCEEREEEVEVERTVPPIMWRIVRINGDGSIRLIVDFNEMNVSTFNYSSDEVGSYSDLKTDVESWYNENLTDRYLNYLEDTIFCGGSGLSTELTCANQYRYTVSNGKLTRPIALITASEAILAGVDSYLGFEDYEVYLTMTHSHTDEVDHMYYVDNNTYVASANGAGSNLSGRIRPVINLKANTLVTGSGTKTDPYVVQTK